MKLEGTPQELAEFLLALTRQEEPEIEEDILGNRYFVNPEYVSGPIKAMEDAIRSTIVGVGVDRSGR